MITRLPECTKEFDPHPQPILSECQSTIAQVILGKLSSASLFQQAAYQPGQAPGFFLQWGKFTVGKNPSWKVGLDSLFLCHGCHGASWVLDDNFILAVLSLFDRFTCF